MAVVWMDGKALAAKVRAQVAEEVARERPLGLATILVGDDPASQIYVRSKHAAAKEVGIKTRDLHLPGTTDEDELLALVRALNRDDKIDGILIQLPLPDHLDEKRVLRAVDPIKDVDGFHPFNSGQLFAGEPTLVPATPLGIMALLEEYQVPLVGARAVVVGRSAIVGKPAAMLLLAAHATVTICHSRTADLRSAIGAADVVVAAVGVPGVVTAEMVKAGAAVIDVGINRVEGGLQGDVDAGVADRAALLSPVPGGVGPMTIAMLLRNTLRAAAFRRGELAFPRDPVPAYA